MRPSTRKLRIRLALIALALATAAATTLPLPRAAADHTPIPDTVTLVGLLQSELGCPGDWQPECAATQLQPVAGEPGVFRSTFTVPAGNYAYKVALNGSWDENYGAGGAPGGADISLTAPGTPITFTYDHATHLISDDLPKSVTAEQAAHWVRRTVIAWNLPDQRDGFSYRLFWAAEGGLVNDDGEITGGTSVPLTLIPAGLSAGVRRDFPHLAGYEALAHPGQRAEPDPGHPDRPDRGGVLRRRGRAGLGHRRSTARCAGPHLRPRPGPPTSVRSGATDDRGCRCGHRPRRR